MGAYLAEVLPFWEAHIDQPALPPWERYQAWYSADPAGVAHFADLLETLLSEPTGARDISNTAATIILLDQFPRKLFAGEPRAYAGHDNAAAIAGPLLRHGDDRLLPTAVRVALAMSLCSVEQQAAADAAVNWFDTQLASMKNGDREVLSGFSAIARRRQEVLALYGRYPGRNPMLGRQDTAAEANLRVIGAIEIA
jgi:uncharacterized protein (DUF924 family)